MTTPTIGQATASPADWSWRLQAACRGADTAVFYGSEGERPTSKRAREGRAKELCATCPAAEPCLQYALAHRERFGVWGGLGEQERQAMRQGSGISADADTFVLLRCRQGTR